MEKPTNMDSVKRLLMANIINLMTVACADGKISPEDAGEVKIPGKEITLL